MRKFIFIFVLFSCQYIYAQHCPYDGSDLVAVKIIDEKGFTVDLQNNTLFLEEIISKETDSCSYKPGQIRKTLLNKENFQADCDNRFSEPNSHVLNNRLKKMGIMDKAGWLISLNQAGHYCMINNNGNINYTKRKFEIVYLISKKEIRFPVQPEDIKSLCTGSKDLVNFKPIVIQVPRK